MIEQLITLDAAPAAQGSGWSSMLMIVALIAIFYFMMIRPQQKKQKEIKKFRESLKEGDRVVTSGGLLGKIAGIKEDSFTVDLGNNIKVRVAKECVFPSAGAAQENAQADVKKQ